MVFSSNLCSRTSFLVNTKGKSLENTEQRVSTMVRVNQIRSNASLKKTTDHILSRGQLNRQEYAQLTLLLLANHKITSQELRTINRIFDSVKQGTLKVID